VRVIDDPNKTAALVAGLKAGLPFPARPTAELLKALRHRSPALDFSHHCSITDIYYAGDEGGILCTLDFGLDGCKEAIIVSITHLRFDRNAPLSRDTAQYQRHRVKKLRRLHQRPF
jgi:hypothetical protein